MIKIAHLYEDDSWITLCGEEILFGRCGAEDQVVPCESCHTIADRRRNTKHRAQIDLLIERAIKPVREGIPLIWDLNTHKPIGRITINSDGTFTGHFSEEVFIELGKQVESEEVDILCVGFSFRGARPRTGEVIHND